MLSPAEDLFDLQGRTALVTGGARGIGAFIAEGLARAGVRVFVTSRDDAAAQAMAKQLGRDCVGLSADLLRMEDLDRLAQQVESRTPRLDILVNNSGAFCRAPLESYPEAGWDDVMDLNVKAAFFLTQKLQPKLAATSTADDPGRVVNISSIAGVRAYDNDTYSYMASKAALDHLTRALAARLARDHITVNAIAPGPMAGGMMRRTTEDDAFREQVESRIPLRRVGTAEDLDGAVRFFCSRAGRYLTGVVLPLDGGASTCPPP